MADFDFGDDAWIGDFDPDEAVRNRNAQRKNNQDANNISTTPSNNEGGMNENERFKKGDISNSGRSPGSGNNNFPFRSNSKYSVGTKTNPDEFISPYGRNQKMNNNPYKKRSNPNNLNSDTNESPPKKQQSNLIHQIQRNIHPSPSPFQDTSPTIQADLEKTLKKYFGYSKFRPGQLPIINILLQNRDAAVFWATGSGKSLCYQIPPLHTGNIALVVSPLISLMEDQVAKINGIIADENDEGGGGKKKKELAVFLGSGQKDPLAERKALNGEYQLIYCTPEKLLSGAGRFLDQVGALHTKSGGKNLCLIAVDESHCVSEWGHDFRPEYRRLGRVIRGHAVLRKVPIVALTATAVPRVQTDIISSLQLRDPNIVKQSFDRDNLIITIKRKPGGGYRTALASFVKEMKHAKKKKSFRHESTIIYCTTQSQVEDITSWLCDQFEGSGIRVQSYHGGQGIEHRSDSHINFLTGKTSVIVATLAFGMGIDKLDTRRIIHYGPPKTVEEYYQQIGRAGRDGLKAHCIMYCNGADFDQYTGDFYLGGLNADARSNQVMSINALRSYAMSDEVCRRAELLNFFDETPIFGERCGTCDTCVSRMVHSNDIERDFADSGARLVLYAISVLNDKQGISNIEKILKGCKIERYRYITNSVDPESVKEKVNQMKAKMNGYKKRVPVSYFTKDLLPGLVSRGYVGVLSQSIKVNGRDRNWSSYILTVDGRMSLHSGPIVLPVPSSIREYEKEHKEKIEKSLQDLKEAGADVDQIPNHELEEGDGTVFKALRTWYNYIDSLQRNERTERIDQLEDLRLRIDAWRMDVAEKNRIAPADAMPDHLLLSVAYTAASLKNGQMEKEALIAAGVRSGLIDDLVGAINDWIVENRAASLTSEATSFDSKSKCVMRFPNEPFKPSKPWTFFVYKPQKKTGLASWESSYNRFNAGEHPQTIAMSPLSGRPIQVNTVIGHIFDGVLSGRAVNLKYLSTLSSPPTKSQWDELSRAEVETEISVIGDPKTSGKNGESLRMTDFLAPIMGDTFVSKEYSDRTDEEKAKFGKWCQLFKWYATLKRIGYEPIFSRTSDADTEAGVSAE